MQHVVIIGNGIAGVTAARHIRMLSDAAITIVSGESDHFYSRTALMYIYMGHMTYEQTKPYEDWFWKKNRINLVRGWVERIDTAGRRLELTDDRFIHYDVLVIATGSKSNRFGWPGQDLDGVQGLCNLQDLEAMEASTRGVEHAVIVGGGLIGIEVAEMLASRRIRSTFLVRERTYWGNVLPEEEGKMIGRHIESHGVGLRLSTQLKEILPDAAGRVCAVVTDAGDRIDCGFVVLTAGVSPNIDLLRNSGIETQHGVLVDRHFETSVPGVYAIGDCAQFREPKEGHPPVEQLWYTGRMHGETVARTICGHRTAYDRGIWFNSAKFFDIEYQTYGMVLPEPRPDEAALYWEHPDGARAIRIVYGREREEVRGFNVLGIRYRHRLVEGWIREGRTLPDVLANLSDANFDPEFFHRFEPAVVDLYNRRSGKPPIVLKGPGSRRFAPNNRSVAR